jgi:hypothetical protein
MLQAEVNKFLSCLYFKNNINGSPHDQLLKIQQFPIVVRGEDRPAVEEQDKPGNFPRLEYEFERALSVLHFDENENNNLEIKKALLYRVQLIRNWMLLQMQDIRNMAEEVYEKLDDWVVDVVKAENTASNDCVREVKELIDDERGLLRIDMRIRTMDYFDFMTAVSDQVVFIDSVGKKESGPLSTSLFRTSISFDQLMSLYIDFKNMTVEDFLQPSQIRDALLLAIVISFVILLGKWKYAK